MSFWDFISSWPLWFQIMFVVIVLVNIFFIIKRGIDFKKGKISFKIGYGRKSNKDDEEDDEENKDKKETPGNPHKGCPYSRDILLLLNEFYKLMSEKWNILYVQQMQSQLNFAELRSEQVKLAFQKKYLELLEEKGIKTGISSPQYLTYQLLLKENIRQMLKIYKDAFRDNHFDGMGEKDFSMYLNDKVDLIVAQGINLFNDNYCSGGLITRDELHVKNSELVPKIKEVIVDIFQYAREIVRQNEIKVKEIDEKVNSLVNKYI
ncbi:MAG TPA: hypothetical protein P5136_02775 [Methanofastidiosum sp.]|nr:hypothetical protein [Methanofastidiosum sp.]